MKMTECELKESIDSKRWLCIVRPYYADGVRRGFCGSQETFARGEVAASEPASFLLNE